MASKKSVIQKEKECFFCKKKNNLHLHHMIGGNSRRKISDKYGFVVWLCVEHHTTGRDAVHLNPKGLMNKYLHELAQRYYEANIGTRERFIQEFGKNYL